ncbi:hypothetical protein [Kocuria sabuli]|uniref:hypothetical protein n=1 Tax=Kocuria sabuli TaxID=3071448 RepID=UPI0034D49A74
MGNRDARRQRGVVGAVPRDAVSGVTGEDSTAQDGDGPLVLAAGRTRPEHRNGRRP